MKYWVFEHGDVVGPFSIEELRKREGYSKDTLVSPESVADDHLQWKPVAEFPEILNYRSEEAPKDKPKPSPAPAARKEPDVFSDPYTSQIFAPQRIAGEEEQSLEVPPDISVEEYFSEFYEKESNGLKDVLGIPADLGDSDLYLGRFLQDNIIGRPSKNKRTEIKRIPQSSKQPETYEEYLERRKREEEQHNKDITEKIKKGAPLPPAPAAASAPALAPVEQPQKEEEKKNFIKEIFTHSAKKEEKDHKEDTIKLSNAHEVLIEQEEIVFNKPALKEEKKTEKKEDKKEEKKEAKQETPSAKKAEPLKEIKNLISSLEAQKAAVQAASPKKEAPKQEKPKEEPKPAAAPKQEAPKAQAVPAQTAEPSKQAAPAAQPAKQPVASATPSAATPGAMQPKKEEPARAIPNGPLRHEQTDAQRKKVEDFNTLDFEIERRRIISAPVFESDYKQKRKKSFLMYFFILFLFFGGLFAIVYKTPEMIYKAQETKTPGIAPSLPTLPVEPAVAVKKPVVTPPSTVESAPVPQPVPANIEEQNKQAAIDIVKAHRLSGSNGAVAKYFDSFYKNYVEQGYEASWAAEPLHKDTYIVKYRLVKPRKEPIVYIFEADIKKKTISGALNNAAMDLLEL